MSIWSSIGGFTANNAGDILKTGASLASTAGSIYAANQSAGAIQDAANRSNQLQAAIYEQNRADMAPYRAAGYGALDAQASLLGLGGPYSDKIAQYESAISDDFAPEKNAQQQKILDNLRQKQQAEQGERITNQLRALPGYQFRMNEGIEARDRSAAARGMTLSGAQQKELTQFGQGLADQTYGQQLNRLAGLAGTGQTATTNTAQMGANYGAQAGQNALAGGRARASSYGAMARAGNNLLGNLDYIWGGQ